MALLCSFVAGCVTPPPTLNTSKPVVFDGSLFRPSLYQDGVAIDEFDATARFAEIPEAKSSARNSNILFWSSVGASGAGGWFLGTWLGQSDRKSENLALAGGLIGLSWVLMYFRKGEVSEAADIYNNNLKNKKKTAFTVEPGLAPIDGGGVAGVVIRY